MQESKRNATKLKTKGIITQKQCLRTSGKDFRHIRFRSIQASAMDTYIPTLGPPTHSPPITVFWALATCVGSARLRLIGATPSLEGPLELVGAIRGAPAGRLAVCALRSSRVSLPEAVSPDRPSPRAPRQPARSRKLRKRVTKNLKGHRLPELRNPGVGRSGGTEHLSGGERRVARWPSLGAPGPRRPLELRSLQTPQLVLL